MGAHDFLFPLRSMVTGLILCRQSLLSWPEVTVSVQLFQTSGSYNISVPFSVIVHEPWNGEVSASSLLEACRDYRTTLPRLSSHDFYGLISGPHICMTSALPNELFFYPRSDINLSRDLVTEKSQAPEELHKEYPRQCNGTCRDPEVEKNSVFKK